MTLWLKQSTAVDIKVGPFLDSTDGNTVEGGLTITQPDIRLSKNGGAFAQKGSAQTLSHNENGWYTVNLSTTDTNTLGTLVVAIHESGALPVWQTFMVVSANTWDSFFSTDALDVSLIQWLGTAPNALVSSRVDASVGAMASNVLTATAINADAITAAKVAADVSAEIADAVWDEDATAHQTQGTFGQAIGDPAADNTTIWGAVNSNLDATVSSRASQTSVDTVDGIVDAILVDTGTTLDGKVNDIQSRLPAALDSGRMSSNMGALNGSTTAADNLLAGALGLVASTCTTGSSTTSVVTNLTEATDNHYNGRVITFVSGALAGQTASITDYDGTSKTLTVSTLTEAPANTDAFVIS